MTTDPLYPDTRGFKYSQSGTEIRIGRRLFTTFKVTHSQPIEEGIIGETASVPEVLGRTRGKMQVGEGSLETDDVEEAQALINHLGDGFSDMIFNIVVRYIAPNKPGITRELVSCRILDVDEDPGEGPEGVQTSFPISFLYRTFDGKKPFRNQRI